MVWLVSKRFYESALPVKKLELRMSAEMEEEKIDMIESESEREALLENHKAELQRKEKKIWLKDRGTRQRFNVFMIISLLLTTVASIGSWCLLIYRVKSNVSIDHYILLICTSACFTALFVLQVLTAVILFKAYFIIRDAAKTLGINTKD